MGNKYNSRINSLRSSDYKKEKFASIAITSIVFVFILYFIGTYKFSFPVETEEVYAELFLDSEFDNHFEVEDKYFQVPENEDMENIMLSDSVENTQIKPSVPEKIITPPKEKETKNIKTEKPKSIEKDKPSKSKGRIMLSHVPGTLGKSGKLPGNDCKATGTIIYYYTVDKEGKVIKVWKSSGNSNACLVKTGINWIKKYVKLNKGDKEWTGTYTIKFK